MRPLNGGYLKEFTRRERPQSSPVVEAAIVPGSIAHDLVSIAFAAGYELARADARRMLEEAGRMSLDLSSFLASAKASS